MAAKKHHSFLALFLIFVLCVNLFSVQGVLADGEPPTEPPPPTEVVAEPTTGPVVEAPVEPPAEPIEATPLPVEATATPAPETSAPASPESTAEPDTAAPIALANVPENTDVVVLDETGQPLVLGSQEAAEALVSSDPVWCPAGVTNPTPEANNCSGSYGSIALLLAAMRSNPGAFSQNGTIFLEKPGGQGFTTPLILDDSDNSLGAAFATLSAFNLTIQGGWNGNDPGLSGQTNFGVSGSNQGYLQIGTSTNPWAGSITLNDLQFNNISATNAVTVYTSSRSITLNNVDVTQQSGLNYTALLDSHSGNIVVQNGSSFDGDNTGTDTNQGFSATTTGSITVTGTSSNPIAFTDAGGTSGNYSGATLNASTVSLSHVTSDGNDADGLSIFAGSAATLSNVSANNNGDDGVVISGAATVSATGVNADNNGGDGIEINSTGTGSAVTLNNSSADNNDEDGVAISNAATVSATNSTVDNNGGDGIDITNADTVTVNSVTASNNNDNGIEITNVNLVNLNNVISGPNQNNEGNGGSGVYVDGTGSKIVSVNGGVFADNGRYGIEIIGGKLFIRANPICPTTGNRRNTLGCYSIPESSDLTGPVISANISGTAGSNGWYRSDVSVSWTVTDPESGILSSSGCDNSSLTSETSGTTFTCSATNGDGVSSSASLTIKIDKTAPALSLPNMIVEATSSAGAVVSYKASATDNLDANVTVSCIPPSGSLFAMGDTPVGCSAHDLAGNSASGNFMVTVQDTVGPVIAAHADVTAEAISAAGAIVNYDLPIATDAVDGSVAVICSPVPGTQFALGDTTVTCNAADSRGNPAVPTTFAVHVVDTTAPVIAAHADITAEATSAAGAIVSYINPSATDAVDGSVAVSCSPVPGTQFPLGNTTVTCNATDSHGNAAIPTTFTVKVVDTTAPVIASHADVTAEATSASGAVVSYINPSATDAVDGSVSVHCSPASGTLFALGNTAVTCNAMDTHGNVAAPASFTVRVVDTTAPTLSLPSTITANATGPSGASVAFSSSASDDVDGSVPVSCSPASGSTFPLGSTTVTCTATDAHDNSASGSFIVNVQDPDAPIITVPGNLVFEATGPTGANVSYAVSALDAVDGPVPVSCVPGHGNFALGTTTVTCSAGDQSGNTNTAAFLVTVEDTTAPSITPHSDFTADVYTENGIQVNYNSPLTYDVVDGPGVASCEPASGSLFSVGDTQVTCTATDKHGNTATSTFFIHVIAAPSSAPSSTLPSLTDFIIPQTGGELIHLECNNVFWAFGIKVSFFNLCDQQTTLHSVEAKDLPGELPAGSSFVMGLNVDVMTNGQILTNLPDGTGIEMDFPLYRQPLDQFAVLYWSDPDGNGKGEWLEVAKQAPQNEISQLLTSSAGEELYQLIVEVESAFYPVLTTDQTGIFVLVKK